MPSVQEWVMVMKPNLLKYNVPGSNHKQPTCISTLFDK